MENIYSESGCVALIEALRNSDLYIKDIYLFGGCYQFYLFLKTIYPDAKAFISKDKQHVVTQVYGKMFDIQGIVSPRDENNFRPLIEESEVNECQSWSFHKHNRLQVNECPNCGEPICYESELQTK
jgi:hypothetical protein